MPIGSRLTGAATGPAVAPRDPGAAQLEADGAPGGGLRVLRYDETLLTEVADVGLATLVLRPSEGAGFFYLIDRILIACDHSGPGPWLAYFYRGEGLYVGTLQNLVERSLSADFDIADEVPPLIHPATTALTCWFYAPTGTECVVRYQYRVAAL